MSSRSIDRLEAAERVAAELLLDDPGLVLRIGIAERRLDEEAVELRLGQRERSLVLDRVLRRQHEERVVEPAGLAVDRHLLLGHRLEERGLRLRHRAVDLVDEDDVREDGPGAELEVALLLVEDREAGDVGRLQVRRALDAARRAPRIEPAIARASTVFAVPGTSSSRAWPPHMSAATTSLICSRLPCTTVSMLSRKRSATSVAEVSSSAATHDLRGERDEGTIES